MTEVRRFINRHALLAYFVLTFAISWGGVLLVIGGVVGFSGAMAQASPLFPFAVAAMVAGPSATGLLLIVVTCGRESLRDLGSRLLRWRLSAGWYAMALLAAPSVAILALLALRSISPEFSPAIAAADNKTGLLLMGLAVGLVAGTFEEIGWTGFAVPELRKRHGVLLTGLIIGAVWSAWHILVVVWGIGDRAGTVPLAWFIFLDGLFLLPAFRVLMVWVYDRTGSLLMVVLMHLSLTVCTLVLWPATRGFPLMAYDATCALAIWIVIATIATRRHQRFSPMLVRAH